MDFRLRVFISVVRNLNFTKAAKELHISQPAISKHIQELEQTYSVQLFERMGSKIALTAPGEVFLKHAEAIVESYRALSLEMNLMSGSFKGTLRIGASSTIAQYILPKFIARFISYFPEIRLTVTTGNSENIENAIRDHTIDVGLVEGDSRRAGCRYTLLCKDELVLVTSVKNSIKEEVSIEELSMLPLVLREAGSGTLEVIEKSLAKHNLNISNMNVVLQLGSTVSIKSFLINSPSMYAVISISALTSELLCNELKVVEVNGLTFDREFVFVMQQGVHNELVDKFVDFMHNQKL